MDSFKPNSANDALVDTVILAERESIQRMSKLSHSHWLALLLSLLLTTGAWYFTNEQVTTQVEDRFHRYSDQLVELVEERMQHYEDALASAVAAIQATGGDISHPQWVDFTETLNIETKYPGINGMGVIYRVERGDAEQFVTAHRKYQPGFSIHPSHEGNTLYPITYIEPLAANALALGLDMAHEANRLQATLRARDSSEPQITGPIVLVQDAQKTPGFLFYMPFYRGDWSEPGFNRRENFIGMVYAPFVFKNLIEGLPGGNNRLVNFSIRDNGSVLYDESDLPGTAAEPEFSRTVDIHAYGRTWTFEIWETPEFVAANRSNEPIMILAGGLIIDGLLFCLFIMLAHSNNRALRFADLMTAEAYDRAESLQRSNEDLERFAYVASHDLKTPLRGIGHLTECIREDVEELRDDTKGSELFENLSLLDDQVNRMESLISGILTYSSIQQVDDIGERVSLPRMLTSICKTAGLKPEQYNLICEVKQITTDAIRLEQVLQNLIDNAKKYHHDPENLQLQLKIVDRKDRLAFTITDNGPGIDPRFHDKIFEMFQTISPGHTADSTGIGLAVVAKIVDLYEGQITLESKPGHGSSFTFDWPKELGEKTPMKEAA